MFHGIGKQISVVLFMVGLPVILLSLLFTGVLFAAFFCTLSR
jgi:hypothetical protein